MAKFYTAMGDDNPSKLIASPACCLARVSLIVVLLGKCFPSLYERCFYFINNET